MHPLSRLFFLFAPAFLLAPPVVAANLADTELKGEIYRSFELIAPIPDFCRKVCERDETCEGWTFSWPGKRAEKAKCFLLKKVAEKAADTCCIAGYKNPPPTAAARQKEPERKERPSSDAAAAERSAAKDAKARVKDAQTVKTRAEESAASRTPSADDARSAAAESPVASEEAQAPAPDEATTGGKEERSRASQATESTQVEDIGKRRFCEDYADAAVAANRAAARLGCGFAGGLWGASRNGYFNWCMKNDRYLAESNTRKRQAAVRKCRRAAFSREKPPAPPPLAGRDAPVPFEMLDRPQRWERFAPPPGRRLLRRRAGFVYSWLKRSGPGPLRSPWRPTLSGKCPMVRACDCPQGNSCRVYPPGGIAVIWPLGCDGPPATYVCRVRRR